MAKSRQRKKTVAQPQTFANKREVGADGLEIFESSEALAEKVGTAEEFVEKNKSIFSILGVVLLVAIAGIFLFRYWQDAQDKEAQSELFQAVYYFESDSLNLALNGDGNNLGFVDIIEDYGMTPAGNLAKYYAGACYLKDGSYNQAIGNLESFSTGDPLVQARAYALIGDAHMELGEFDDAAGNYSKAANYETNEFFSPDYFKKASVAYEQLGEYGDAAAQLEKIVSMYPTSTAATDAKKYLARLQAIAN